jgi:hypothetical protein
VAWRPPIGATLTPKARYIELLERWTTRHPDPLLGRGAAAA